MILIYETSTEYMPTVVYKYYVIYDVCINILIYHVSCDKNGISDFMGS